LSLLEHAQFIHRINIFIDNDYQYTNIRDNLYYCKRSLQELSTEALLNKSTLNNNNNNKIVTIKDICLNSSTNYVERDLLLNNNNNNNNNNYFHNYYNYQQRQHNFINNSPEFGSYQDLLSTLPSFRMATTVLPFNNNKPLVNQQQLNFSNQSDSQLQYSSMFTPLTSAFKSNIFQIQAANKFKNENTCCYSLVSSPSSNNEEMDDDHHHHQQQQQQQDEKVIESEQKFQLLSSLNNSNNDNNSQSINDSSFDSNQSSPNSSMIKMNNNDILKSIFHLVKLSLIMFTDF
jgi:hypothetical protein